MTTRSDSGFSGFAPPTQRLHLTQAGYRLELWPELGCGIACFEHSDGAGGYRPLFRPAPVLPRYTATDLGNWPLVPYSNRIGYGRFDWHGRTYRLPRNVPPHPHSLHGVGWQRSWQVIAHTAASCRLRLDHQGDQDWPFAFRAEQDFALSDDGLTITSTLTNRHAGAAPCGFGQHPYIHRPPGTRLTAQVAGVWLTDYTIMPLRHVTDLPPAWNLPQGVDLDNAVLDNCFTGAVGAAEVRWPDGARLLIGGGDDLPFLVVYRPVDDPYVCVEYVSHSTDAINRHVQGEAGTGFRQLAHAETAETCHRFSYRAAA